MMDRGAKNLSNKKQSVYPHIHKRKQNENFTKMN